MKGTLNWSNVSAFATIMKEFGSSILRWSIIGLELPQ